VARLTLGVALLALSCAGPARADPVDRWSGYIAEAAARFAIPAAWIARVMRAESGGHRRRAGRPIVSRAGAMGLMQLMPGTWADMRAALRLGADPFDPHDNILAGARYLRLLYDRFGYPGLFGAYNAGPARYAAWLEGQEGLPEETRAYLAGMSEPMPAAFGSRGVRQAGIFFPLGQSFATSDEPASPSRLFIPLHH